MLTRKNPASFVVKFLVMNTTFVLSPSRIPVCPIDQAGEALKALV